jgi:hypothetical protein
MAESPPPQNLRASISLDRLQELYVDQAKTLEQVGQQLGLAPITVRRRMRELGIPARPRGPTRNHQLRCFRTAWSREIAYVVGVITTDGTLSSDRRHLGVTSKDVDFLETIRRCLKLDVAITRCSSPSSGCHRIQWSDRTFYEWLLTLGLMPAKSLRLGPLRIPDEFFADFLRGCIDGDGSIVTYVDRFHAPRNPRYIYDRLFVSIVSASRPFLGWIQSTALRLRGVSGHLTLRKHNEHHDLWSLRYAKRESVDVLRWIYYAPDLPALFRKRQRAERALASVTWYRHSLSDIDTH